MKKFLLTCLALVVTCVVMLSPVEAITIINPPAGSAGTATWGSISGTLADQTDLGTALDARCLESVFGTSISTGLLLTGSVLSVSAVLQEYHAVNPTAAGLALLDDAAASNQRTTLGLVIDTNVQAYSSVLDTYAGIDPSADVQSVLGCADEAAIRTFLDLEAGTDFYSMTAAAAAFEAELDDSAGLLAALDDETGTGVAVFATAPTFVTSITIGSATLTEPELEILDDATLSTTQLNYLTSATGTTGTATTNLVFSTSPTLVTPTLGAATATSLTLDASALPGWVFRDSGTPGADREVAKIYANYLTGAEDAEDGGLYLQARIAGSEVTFITLDGENEKISLGKYVDTFEMGHVSDTTISRSAAGTVQVEDVTVSLDGDQDRWQAIYVAAAACEADGTNCADAAAAQINSGPNAYYIICSDAAGTIEAFIGMPENWDGGSIIIEPRMFSTEASPAGSVEWELSIQKVSHDETIDNTWVTTNGNVYFEDAETAGTTMDTQYDLFQSKNATAMATGGASKDDLFVKLTRDNDDGTHDASTQSVNVLGFTVYYQIDDLDEKD